MNNYHPVLPGQYGRYITQEHLERSEDITDLAWVSRVRFEADFFLKNEKMHEFLSRVWKKLHKGGGMSEGERKHMQSVERKVDRDKSRTFQARFNSEDAARRVLRFQIATSAGACVLEPVQQVACNPGQFWNERAFKATSDTTA